VGANPTAWTRGRTTPVVVAVAATAYAVTLSAASLARHRWLNTGGYDLGIFDQAVWLLGHGDAPFSTIRGRNLFADHFQPALVVLAPLGMFGLLPAGLLILQSCLLAAVSPVLYVLARARGASRGLALAVAVIWLASPLTQWANLFDYHPETVVPLLIALGALLLERRRTGWFVVTAVFACCFKEDVTLVYLMWGIVLAVAGRRRLGLGLAAAAAVWFAVATKVAIPAWGGNFDYYSTRFAGDRGSSVGSVFVELARHPLRILGDTATPANAKILFALVACSGGLALLAPRLLALALPAVLANLLSAYSYQHELRFHYELVPAAVFAVASAFGAGVLERRVAPRTERLVAGALIAGAVLVAVALSPVSELFRERHRSANADAKRHALSLIPGGVAVAAAPDLAPHLTHRRALYQLPEPWFTRPTNGEYWSDAELARRARAVRYVAYATDTLDPYPAEQTRRLPALLRRQGFEEIYRSGDVRVFRRR
jgi:uncharacterized membrane protein